MTIWVGGDKTQVGCMQGECLPSYAVSPALNRTILKKPWKKKKKKKKPWRFDS